MDRSQRFASKESLLSNRMHWCRGQIDVSQVVASIKSMFLNCLEVGSITKVHLQYLVSIHKGLFGNIFTSVSDSDMGDIFRDIKLPIIFTRVHKNLGIRIFRIWILQLEATIQGIPFYLIKLDRYTQFEQGLAAIKGVLFDSFQSIGTRKANLAQLDTPQKGFLANPLKVLREMHLHQGLALVKGRFPNGLGLRVGRKDDGFQMLAILKGLGRNTGGFCSNFDTLDIGRNSLLLAVGLGLLFLTFCFVFLAFFFLSRALFFSFFTGAL
mmetsp:Transcript_25180/g.62072  ORF Transcript_25180/g.62072 Transcript_25180/m.62072 type:complete len:268 (-) Transcript_25180:1340-2143(-)